MDMMAGAPSIVDREQLEELHIRYAEGLDPEKQ
jgi:aspartyl-tRNA synthetase